MKHEKRDDDCSRKCTTSLSGLRNIQISLRYRSGTCETATITAGEGTKFSRSPHVVDGRFFLTSSRTALLPITVAAALAIAPVSSTVARAAPPAAAD